MLIPVVYIDGRHDWVKPPILDQLIEDRQISHFRRSSGWVELGKDPVRQPNRKVYCIPERRQAELIL